MVDDVLCILPKCEQSRNVVEQQRRCADLGADGAGAVVGAQKASDEQASAVGTRIPFD